MTIADLAPAAERMTALIGGVPDEMLGGRRPVPKPPWAPCCTTSAP